MHVFQLDSCHQTSGLTLSHSPQRSAIRTLNELHKELFTIQTSLIDLILFHNFLLKFANESPSGIKPGRTLWCPEFKRLLWSPTQLSSCISVHLEKTWNSPDLFVCFSFGQSSNRWTIMTPAVSSLHSAKTRRCDRCGESSSQPQQPSRRTEGEGSHSKGSEGDSQAGEPATGCRDWLWQLCLLALLPVCGEFANDG